MLYKETLVNATDANNKAQAIMLAGDDEFDIMAVTDRNALAHAIEGMVLRYDEMPYIDLTRDYWCRRINDCMTIGGKSYLAYGDFSMSVYDYTFNLAFNHRLLKDLALDDPYRLVDEGIWTFDNFYEMGASAYSDLNGNGVRDENDRWGWFAIPKQISPCMWVAAGQTPIKKDADDRPAFTLEGDEQFAAVFEKILKMTWDGESWYPNKFNADPTISPMFANGNCLFVTSSPMFANGNCLFVTSSFGMLDKDYFRAMEDDYGILPHPKWDEVQDDYYTRVEGGRIHVIPVTIQDREFTGMMLEALACESANVVIPVYFEVALKAKYTRDSRSAQMFDLVMDSRVYDLAETFWCSYIRDGFIYTLFQQNSNALASSAAANKEKMDTLIGDTIDAYLSLD